MPHLTGTRAQHAEFWGLPTDAQTVWPGVAKFCTATRGRGLFLGLDMPHPKRWGPSVPRFFGTPTDDHMVRPRVTKIGKVTTWRMCGFVGVRYAPCPKGPGSSTSVHMVWETLTKFCRMKKRSERCKHCALAVVRRSQKFLPRHRLPSRGHRMAKI